MKLSAALQYEGMRDDPQSWNKIYLNKDGKFFHAYQWSAWLLKRYVCTEELQQSRGDEKMLAASRTPTKDGEYVMAGFPVESLGKYVPEYEAMNPVEDGGGDVVFEIALPADFNGKSYEELSAVFKEWYDTCPMREPKQKPGKPAPTSSQMATGRNGMFHILSQILSYPVESKTPVENVEFIGELKRQIVSLL